MIGPDDTSLRTIRQLLFPWLVEFVPVEKADVVIAYKTMEKTGSPTVLVPSETPEFSRWSKGNEEEVLLIDDRTLEVPVTDRLTLFFKPITARLCGKLFGTQIKDTVHLVDRLDGPTVLLPVDIVCEYSLRMGQMLDPAVSSLFRFVTGLPVPYTWVPSSLRNLIFRPGKEIHDESLLHHLELDALRHLLVLGIQEVSGIRLLKKRWDGHSYACCITHDVETRAGLSRSAALRNLEEHYDVPSTWFLPTKRYDLDSEAVSRLASQGEVGAHDTRHDGKLLQSSRESIVKRVREAKDALEKISGRDIAGFRSPLLQHSRVFFECLQEAGYTYDSSVPSWEPRHPSTMSPCGIGTVYPLDVNGLSEIVVSLPQDHQMIQVLGLDAEQTVERWLEMKEVIKDLGGVCTILVHPDYVLGDREGLQAYEELLNAITADDQALITVPSNIARGIF